MYIYYSLYGGVILAAVETRDPEYEASLGRFKVLRVPDGVYDPAVLTDGRHVVDEKGEVKAL